MKDNLERELEKTYENVVYTIKMRKRKIFQTKLVVSMIKELLQLFELEATGEATQKFVLNVENSIIKIDGEKRVLMSCYWNYLNNNEREYFFELLERYFTVKKVEGKKNKTLNELEISLKIPENKKNN